MAEKPRKKRPKYQEKRRRKVSQRDPIQAARFDWEFLRRNERYRNDYGRFLLKYPTYEAANGGTPDWLVEESQKRGEDTREFSKGSFICRFTEDQAEFMRDWKVSPTSPDTTRSPFLSHRTLWVLC
jgi:hypothetical protein